MSSLAMGQLGLPRHGRALGVLWAPRGSAEGPRGAEGTATGYRQGPQSCGALQASRGPSELWGAEGTPGCRGALRGPRGAAGAAGCGAAGQARPAGCPLPGVPPALGPSGSAAPAAVRNPAAEAASGSSRPMGWCCAAAGPVTSWPCSRRQRGEKPGPGAAGPAAWPGLATNMPFDFRR